MNGSDNSGDLSKLRDELLAHVLECNAALCEMCRMFEDVDRQCKASADAETKKRQEDWEQRKEWEGD